MRCCEANCKGPSANCETYMPNCTSDSKAFLQIQQEVIDSLIATRCSYEPNREGVEEVMERKYELQTSTYELLYHREQLDPNFQTQFRNNQVFVILRSSNGYVLVACRGTFTLSDVVQDIKVARIPTEMGNGKAHVGFVERAMSMPLQLFISLLRAGEKIIFTGHSLGGAVASLITLRVLQALASVPGHLPIGASNVQCITFASAPFADLELASFVNSRYRKYFHHLVSKHDVVPRCHNIVPHFFIPAAKWVVDTIRNRWEAKACKAMIESMTKLPIEKAVMKLEEKCPKLWPATQFFRYVQRCAAQDVESVFFGLSGYVLLLDPDARTSESAMTMNDMESLGTEFCLEDKSVLDVYFEHGLRNHYQCLVTTLLGPNKNAQSLEDFPTVPAAQKTLPKVLLSSRSMRRLIRSPSGTCLGYLNRGLMRVTGNEFPTI